LEEYLKRPAECASALIDERMEELEDRRGKTLAKVRAIISGYTAMRRSGVA
jgi:hypothetical protein